MVVLPIYPRPQYAYSTGMEMPGILERIDQRSIGLNLSDSAISQKAGMSPDGIRNWRRRVASGELDVGANAKSLDRIALALGVNIQWLTTGEGEMLSESGFAEPPADALHPMMTRPRRILEKMLERESRQDRPHDGASVQIAVDGKLAQIIAVIDRKGIAALRRKLEAIEALLDDESG